MNLGKKQEELLAKYQIDLDRRMANCIPLAWIPLLEETFIKLIAAGWDRKAIQIKSKFGGLRFYIMSNVEGLNDIISDAENRSYELCDVCGEPGKECGENWVAIRCAEHENWTWREREKYEEVLEKNADLLKAAEEMDKKYGGNIEQEVADARANGEPEVDFPWRKNEI